MTLTNTILSAQLSLIKNLIRAEELKAKRKMIKIIVI